MILSMIFARSQNNVIGKDNTLIWHLPADLKFFKKLTSGHTIIMGRKTYESIGKPLPNRTSVIISRQKDYQPEGTIVVHSLEDAIKFAKNQGETEAFIIGGEQIYTLAMPLTEKIYLTEVHETFEGDAFAPKLDENLWTVANREDFEPDDKNKFAYSFITLLKK